MALISIVIPVYFNHQSLHKLAERLDLLSKANPKHNFEFVFVDDGSKDNSFLVLKSLAEEDHRIRVIKLARNFGANTAILAGLGYARGDCIGCIAADLQDPPEAFTEMISEWEAGQRIVLAVRENRLGDPFLTRIFASLFNFFFSKFVYQGFSPQGVGFFLIDRLVCNAVLDCEEKNAHVIGLIFWTGFPASQIIYHRALREEGKSRWTFSKKIKYFIDAFVAFSYLPLRLSSTLGFILAFIGGLYAIDVIVNRLHNKITIPGWTTLTVLILFLSGIQLLMLGIIGEYLWRNLETSRRRPLFIVDTVIENKTQHNEKTKEEDSRNTEDAH
jgi:polyisoprenyl-phosphate glycosyltransferase